MIVAEALKAWYLFSFSLGFYTCLNLVFSRYAQREIRNIMIVFLSLLLIPSINSYLQVLNGGSIFILTSLSQNLTLAYGPLLYILVKKSLRCDVTVKKIALHLLPFIVVNMERLMGAPLTGYSYAYPIIVFLQITGYLFVSIRLLINNKARFLSLVKGHKNSSYFWLLFLCIGLLVVTILDIVVIIYASIISVPELYVISAIACIISVYVNVIALFVLYQPHVFIPKETAHTDEIEPPKIRHVELSMETAQSLDHQLGHLVDTHKPHLDEDISLSKLAALLGVTRSQLSELFNVHKQISFYDFLNDLRYQESIRLLSDLDIRLTIADIAYQAGFNNRNSFYKVFKEKKGMTPTQFRKNLANDTL